MWHVKILGGGKKNLDQREYNIPAKNENEAYGWGVEQAQSLGIESPVIQVEEVAEVVAVAAEAKEEYAWVRIPAH
jgi:hypothetical protein